jgi:hypothetical protein
MLRITSSFRSTRMLITLPRRGTITAKRPATSCRTMVNTAATAQLESKQNEIDNAFRKEIKHIRDGRDEGSNCFRSNSTDGLDGQCQNAAYKLRNLPLSTPTAVMKN